MLEKILNMWYNYKNYIKGDFYMKPSTLRNITIVVAVLGLIGGVILGFKFKTVEINRLYTEEHFNAMLMLSVWIATALYSVISLALASILENQEHIISQLWKQSQTTSRNPDGVNSKINLSAIAAKEKSAANNIWICPDCDETNPANTRICKSCGYEK